MVGALDLLAGDLQRSRGRLLDQRQGAGESGLAAAGLADHGEGLAGLQFEGHAVQGADQGVRLEHALGDFVVTGQVAGGQYGFHQTTSFRFSGK
ncbi:hypothetical protein D3C78_1432500 [compost metagenome]